LGYCRSTGYCAVQETGGLTTLFKLPEGKMVRLLDTVRPCLGTYAAFSADGKRMLVVQNEATVTSRYSVDTYMFSIRSISVETGKEINYTQVEGIADGVSFLRGNHRAVISYRVNNDRFVLLWDVASCQPLQIVHGEGEGLSLQMSPDGQSVAITLGLPAG